MSLAMNTVAAPRAIIAQEKQVARRACTTGLMFCTRSIISSIYNSTPSHVYLLLLVCIGKGLFPQFLQLFDKIFKGRPLIDVVDVDVLNHPPFVNYEKGPL